MKPFTFHSGMAPEAVRSRSASRARAYTCGSGSMDQGAWIREFVGHPCSNPRGGSSTLWITRKPLCADRQWMAAARLILGGVR